MRRESSSRIEDQSSPSRKDRGNPASRNESFYTAVPIDPPVHELIRRCKLDFDGYTLNSSAVWKKKRLVLTSDSFHFVVNKGKDEQKLETVDSIPLHEIVNVRGMDLNSFLASFEQKKSKRQKGRTSFQSATALLAVTSEKACDISENPTTTTNQATSATSAKASSGTTGSFNTREANPAHLRAMYRSFSRGALKNIDHIVTSAESQTAIEVTTVEGGYNDGQVDRLTSSRSSSYSHEVTTHIAL
jgi:hypothetical protein